MLKEGRLARRGKSLERPGKVVGKPWRPWEALGGAGRGGVRKRILFYLDNGNDKK